MASLSREAGSGGIFFRGTGSWIMVLTLAIGLGDLQGNLVPLRECSDTDGAHTVDDTDAKCIYAGALGGRATHTVDKTIRPMDPMVSLALPPPSRLTKRRAELFSKIY